MFYPFKVKSNHIWGEMVCYGMKAVWCPVDENMGISTSTVLITKYTPVSLNALNLRHKAKNKYTEYLGNLHAS